MKVLNTIIKLMKGKTEIYDKMKDKEQIKKYLEYVDRTLKESKAKVKTLEKEIKELERKAQENIIKIQRLL